MATLVAMSINYYSLSEWQGHLLSCPGQLKKFIGNVFNYLKIIWLQDDLDTGASKLRSQKSSRYHLRGSDWKINPFVKGSGHCAKSCSNRQKSPHFLKGGRGGDTQLQLLLAQRQPLQRQVVQGPLQLLLFYIEIESSYCLKESFKMHFKGSSPILVIYASRISHLEVLSHKRHESQCKLPSLNLCVVAIYKSYFRFTSLRSISFSWRLYPGGWQVRERNKKL